MVLWALGHQQALFLAFWAICAPHCAFAAPSPLRPSFDNPSRMLAQPHSTVASDDPRILPSAISVGMTATTSLVPADLPSGTPAHFVTESWTANDTPESPRGIAQGPVVSSPEEQAVAAWAPALKEGSTQKSFVSPLTDAPFIVVAALALTLILATPHLLKSVSMLLVAASLCFCMSTVFELIRGSESSDAHPHTGPRSLALSYLSALPQSIGSCLVCLWLTLYQPYALVDLAWFLRGELTTAKLRPDRLAANSSYARAVGVGPLGFRRRALLIAPAIYGASDLISRLVFVQHGDAARIGWLVGAGTVMAVISLRVVECILSAHTSDAHFLPGPSTLLAVIEVACIVPLVILLLGQVSIALLNCIYLAASESPLGRDARAVHLLFSLVLSSVTDKSSSYLERVLVQDNEEEWPPAYSAAQPQAISEVPSDTQWAITPSSSPIPTSASHPEARHCEQACSAAVSNDEPQYNDQQLHYVGQHDEASEIEARSHDDLDEATQQGGQRLSILYDLATDVVRQPQPLPSTSGAASRLPTQGSRASTVLSHLDLGVFPAPPPFRNIPWHTSGRMEPCVNIGSGARSSVTSGSLPSTLSGMTVIPRHSRMDSSSTQQTHLTVTSFFNTLNNSLAARRKSSTPTKGAARSGGPATTVGPIICVSPLSRCHFPLQAQDEEKGRQGHERPRTSAACDEFNATHHSIPRFTASSTTQWTGSPVRRTHRTHSEPTAPCPAYPRPTRLPRSKSPLQRFSSPLRRCLSPSQGSLASVASELDLLFYTSVEGGPIQTHTVAGSGLSVIRQSHLQKLQ